MAGFAKLTSWLGTAASAFLEEKLVQQVTHFDVAQLYRRSLKRFQFLGERRADNPKRTSGDALASEGEQGE